MYVISVKSIKKHLNGIKVLLNNSFLSKLFRCYAGNKKKRSGQTVAPFQPSVSFHIETSHLFYRAKWVNKAEYVESS